MSPSPLEQRSAGILLHPTSLPGPSLMGDIGPAAMRFVDFLAASGQRWWQMLPVHPIGGGDSPYDSPSAFAGSTLLISLEGLVELGLLDSSDLAGLSDGVEETRAAFDAARRLRPALLKKAYTAFINHASADLVSAYEAFTSQASSWVWDYSLFCALKIENDQKPWWTWDSELRTRQEAALSAAHQKLKANIELEVFFQFLFHHQWQALRRHAHARGVLLMGDIPIYVAHDSADVWANQDMFFLDENGQKLVQAGVPPDYFSEDGQLWGNPIYRWQDMRKSGYGWWIDRLRRELHSFDAVRLDHFIAFHRYWEVPMGAASAREGRYVEAPGADFLAQAEAKLGALPLVAEDLGIVTPEVDALRERFSLPGMKILQFAFSPGAEAYLPHRHPARSVVYTGTHDNNTTRGWFDALLAANGGTLAGAERTSDLARVSAYVGEQTSEGIAWALVQSLYASPSNTAIVPVQDLLSQGSEERMNVPGVGEKNWAYRVPPGALTPELAERLRRLSEITDRV